MNKISLINTDSKQIPYTSTSYVNKDNYNVGPPCKKNIKGNVVSVGLWLVIVISLILLQYIPYISIVVLLVMSFANINQNIKNFSRALLIIFTLKFIYTYIYYL